MKQNKTINKRDMVRKQKEENRESKQNERNQNRGKVVEVNNFGRFFELPTTKNSYVNKIILQEIENEILSDYTGDF